MFFYRNKKYAPFLIIFVIFLFHIVNNYLILSKDNIPFIHDERMYFEDSKSYYAIIRNAVFEKNFSGLSVFLKQRDFSYSPLVPLTSVPFYFLFGLTDDVAVLSLMPYFLILLLSIYKLGQKLYSSNSAGLLAALLVSLFPIIVGFSRVYYLEIPMTALVTLTFVFLLKTDYFKNRKYSILFGITLALTLFVKWISVVFIAGPFLFYAFSSLSPKRSTEVSKKKIVNNFFISLFTCFLFILPFFALFIKPFLSNYNSVFCNVVKYNTSNFSVFEYFTKLYDVQLLPFFTIAFCVAVPVFLIRVKEKGLLISWFLFTCIFFIIIDFCGYFKAQSRFTLPLLPTVALIISSAVFSIKNNKARFTSVIVAFLIAVLIIGGLVQFFRLSYEPGCKYPLLAYAKNSHGLGRYQALIEDWKSKEVSSIVINKSLSNRNSQTIVLPLYNCGILHTLLLEEFSKYAAKSNKNVFYDNLLTLYCGGYSNLQEDKYYENIIKKADIVLIKEGGYLEGCEDPSLENVLGHSLGYKVYMILTKSFKKHKSLFSKVGVFDLPDNSKLVVYEKME